MKNAELRMDCIDLLNKKESEGLDFKQEYHKSKVDFLHDILCLANAYHEEDRYIVFGISNNREILGVECDQNRKQQSDICDFLRNANLNRTIKIELITIKIDAHEIDFLKIYNKPDKPFFLLKDYNEDKKIIRNGVV